MIAKSLSIIAVFVLLILYAIIAATPSSAGADKSDVFTACAREQCLVLDYITKKNVYFTDRDQILKSYGEFQQHDPFIPINLDVGNRQQLCKYFPLVECFSRLITIRQKIYTPKDAERPVGCLVVGGISKYDRAYNAFGVIYVQSDAGWTSVGISYLVSLNDYPSVEDLLSDPCPS